MFEGRYLPEYICSSVATTCLNIVQVDGFESVEAASNINSRPGDIDENMPIKSGLSEIGMIHLKIHLYRHSKRT